MNVAAQVVASIPSPSQGVWYLGPFPIRAYAFAILVGIAAAIWITRRRWAERGGEGRLAECVKRSFDQLHLLSSQVNV